MLQKPKNLYCIIFFLACFFSGHVFSQAFCSLRDPVKVIESFSPEPFLYESALVEIDNSTREFLLSQTGVAMHHQEMGYHTIYVVDKKFGEGRNIIHVRPEATPWGLIEIAWLLDLDGEIKNFNFQRCRAPGCEAVETDIFSEKLARLNLMEMRGLLGDSLRGLSTKGRDLFLVESVSEELIAATIRSGLKASAVASKINL